MHVVHKIWVSVHVYSPLAEEEDDAKAGAWAFRGVDGGVGLLAFRVEWPLPGALLL